MRLRSITIRFALVMLTVACAVSLAHAAEPTTIHLTERVLVKDVVRLGINTGGDNYWDGAITKLRAADNFEGAMYRMTTWGPELDEDGLAVWFSPPESAWEAMKGKVKFTLLGPPNKGATGVIRDIGRKKIRDGRTITYLMFDKKVKPSDLNKNGVLLEYEDFDQGSIRESNNQAFWNTPGNNVHIGDVPKGSFGKAALWLRPAEGEDHAHYTYVPMWASQADQNGTWRVKLWLKRKAGEPTFRVTTEIGESKSIKPTDQWTEHDLKLTVADVDTTAKHVVIRLNVDGGQVLVDDVQIWKEEDDRNPTAFRDHYVNLIKELNPGVLRKLQMGGSDLENNFRPPLKQMGWSNSFANMTRGGRNEANNYKFNLHDYYELCAYVGTRPWYCLPGTMHPDEINKLMEYLAAPADVGYGKVRAELGQPTPWTEVFDKIYIEFGNEAWNPGGHYATGSFNGPDHWQDLIKVGRASRWMRPNIVWVAGSQAGSTGVTKSVLRDVPNADTYAIAPYMMNGTRAEQVADLQGDSEIFRWVFGYAIRRVVEPDGRVYQHRQLTRAAGKELSIYEHNFHLTNPMPGRNGAVALDWRNRMQTSLGAGLCVINDALLMLREHHIMPQAQFNLRQRAFTGGIRLWGFVPGLNINDQRYRPHFLAEQIANRIMTGDLVATRHTGAQPTFAATGYFEDDRDQKQTYDGIPTLWSYAFADGNQRGLIIFNLDTESAHTVAIDFDGATVDGKAQAWRLGADRIAANNESEHEAQVHVTEQMIDGFRPGREIELAPHSMIGLTWQVR